MHRFASTVLLAGGVVLVFAGLSSALGFSPGGIVASLAAIAGLLYAGAVWFAPRVAIDPVSADAAVVFNRQLFVASGRSGGQPLASLFSPEQRADLEQRCREALDGRAVRFACAARGAAQLFEAVPVRGADGTIRYGILLTGSLVSAPAGAELSTTA